jgi:hypothetical protein
MYNRAYFSSVFLNIAYIFIYLHVQSDQREVEHIYAFIKA